MSWITLLRQDCGAYPAAPARTPSEGRETEQAHKPLAIHPRPCRTQSVSLLHRYSALRGSEGELPALRHIHSSDRRLTQGTDISSLFHVKGTRSGMRADRVSLKWGSQEEKSRQASSQDVPILGPKQREEIWEGAKRRETGRSWNVGRWNFNVCLPAYVCTSESGRSLNSWLLRCQTLFPSCYLSALFTLSSSSIQFQVQMNQVCVWRTWYSPQQDFSNVKKICTGVHYTKQRCMCFLKIFRQVWWSDHQETDE